jgi:hypothetical protein
MMDDQTRVIPYNLLDSRVDVTWEDVKKACFTEKSPFTEDEKYELSGLADDDQLFFKRMFEILKSGNK